MNFYFCQHILKHQKLHNCIYVANIQFYQAKYLLYRANILLIEQLLSSKYFMYRAFKFHRFFYKHQQIKKALIV